MTEASTARKAPLPFVRLSYSRNRTRSGRRTVTPARRAAAYFAFGRGRRVLEEERPRGHWAGPAGRPESHDEVMTWIREQARRYEYTFQALLSVPEGRMTAEDYCQALAEAGHIPDWRLVAHNDTAYSHAHVLFFRDGRLDREQFKQWHSRVRQELAALEQKRLNGPELEPGQGLSHFSEVAW